MAGTTEQESSTENDALSSLSTFHSLAVAEGRAGMTAMYLDVIRELDMNDNLLGKALHNVVLEIIRSNPVSNAVVIQKSIKLARENGIQVRTAQNDLTSMCDDCMECIIGFQSVSDNCSMQKVSRRMMKLSRKTGFANSNFISVDLSGQHFPGALALYPFRKTKKLFIRKTANDTRVSVQNIQSLARVCPKISQVKFDCTNVNDVSSLLASLNWTDVDFASGINRVVLKDLLPNSIREHRLGIQDVCKGLKCKEVDLDLTGDRLQTLEEVYTLGRIHYGIHNYQRAIDTFHKVKRDDFTLCSVDCLVGIGSGSGSLAFHCSLGVGILPQ